MHLRLITIVLSGVMVGVGACAHEALEVTAASPSIEDIQEAVDSLEGRTGTVHVPAGEAEAIGTLRLPPGTRLVGAGMEETRLFRGPQTDIHSREAMIQVQGPGPEGTRVSGLNLVGVLDAQSEGSDSGIVLRDVTDFRVAHCRFERFGNAAVHVRGDGVRGLIDNCRMVEIFKPAINNLGYGVVVYGTNEWNDDLQPGGPDAVFVEDCVMIGNRHAIASNAGAVYVFRQNHVYENALTQPIDAHGPGYGSPRGTQWVEIYGNLVERPRRDAPAMLIRGGGGVIFNNTIRDHSRGIGLTLDFDQRLDWSRPYPIPDQVHNVWVWNNTLDGTEVKPYVPERSAEHIKEGRDYHLEQMPDYEPFAYPHPLRGDTALERE